AAPSGATPQPHPFPTRRSSDLDGVTRPVGQPFVVIATQNPIEQAGTYRLPEAQLDRFMIKTSIGYPDDAAMARILAGTAEVRARSEEHTSELQSRENLVCRLLL